VPSIGDSTLSLGIQRHLSLHTQAVGRSMHRLSSGLRITRAAEDPAGLAVAMRLSAREQSIGQAIRNASDGVSALQIAEGAMSESSGLLIRLRELAVQSANGSLSSSERAVLDQEAQGIVQEIDRIASVNDFNGMNLIDGSTASIDLHTGPGASDTLTVTGVDVRASQIGSGAGSQVIDIDISTQAGATTAIGIADAAINQVSSARGALGTVQSRAESQIRSLQISQENLMAAQSRIMDTDIARETAELTKTTMLQQMSVSLLAQGNQQSRIVLDLLSATFR